MSTLDGPLPSSERFATLDIVRGFALLGILIMNMPGFTNSFYIEADGSHLWSHPVDRAAESVRDMLFSGKFNSMFSLLFGIGFTIQFARMQARQPALALTLYLRRLLVLLALGLLHAMVFWTGDVLHVYAILGLLLLVLLRHASDRAILVLIGLCVLYPAVSGALRLVIVTPEITASIVADSRVFEASNNAAYGAGSFVDAAREHVREFVFSYANPWQLWGNFGFYVQMATTMLLGFLVGQHRWYARIPELMPQIRRLQWWALAIGVVCAMVFGAIFQLNRAPGPSLMKILGNVAYTLSRLGLMTFYVLTIVRLAELPAWQRRFAPIAAAGRLPLPNYLMQTLICTAIFYGWGLGFWGKAGPAAQLALAFAVFFVVQVPFSVLYARRFTQGPFEYVWRLLTYGRNYGRTTGATTDRTTIATR